VKASGAASPPEYDIPFLAVVGRRYDFLVSPRICATVVVMFTLWGDGLAQGLKFMGRSVRITTPKTDEDGMFPVGPASVCIEGPPERQCYTAPKDFGRDPSAEVIRLGKGGFALFFSAASGGTSGWTVHFALLRPGTGNQLDDLLDVSVSNQNRHAFWYEPAISDAPIFVTADYQWGPNEGHYSPHRYVISAYALRYSDLSEVSTYFLEDQFMTVRRYDIDDKGDVLKSERQEILDRLKRVRAAYPAR
jgi:hypothetical protein